MPWARLAWCVVAAVVVFGPELAAIVAPFERWPWTHAPMFAASPVSNTLYTSAFVLEKRDGSAAPLSSKATVGVAEFQFRRLFLVSAWGSDDDRVAYYDGDADHRVARVGAFFDAIVAFDRAKKRHTFDDVTAIRVEVHQQKKQKTKALKMQAAPTPARVLGRYLVDERRFVPTRTP